MGRGEGGVCLHLEGVFCFRLEGGLCLKVADATFAAFAAREMHKLSLANGKDGRHFFFDRHKADKCFKSKKRVIANNPLITFSQGKTCQIKKRIKTTMSLTS